MLRASPGRPAALDRAGLARFPALPGHRLFYGTCFVAVGWALLELFDAAAAYVMALPAGFLLMGPFMCLGLYRASQRLERGEKPGFADSLLACESTPGIFGFVLLVLEMLWGRATLVNFAVSATACPT